ncbi:hypothetical protein VIBNISFn118_630011 [Vibrio nigripulchritudo SFn118]|nr:hypothetical protein VIBNISFn118_630011 [Vibrio nigripulchritudo SFn118]
MFLELIELNNGGIPLKRYFTLDGNEKVIGRFLSFVLNYKVSGIGCYDIEVVWSQIERRLNESLCPFAAMYNGDFLCFDNENVEETRIALWDRERSEEDSPFLNEVATNFETFLQMLKS